MRITGKLSGKLRGKLDFSENPLKKITEYGVEPLFLYLYSYPKILLAIFLFSYPKKAFPCESKNARGVGEKGVAKWSVQKNWNGETVLSLMPGSKLPILKRLLCARPCSPASCRTSSVHCL